MDQAKGNLISKVDLVSMVMEATRACSSLGEEWTRVPQLSGVQQGYACVCDTQPYTSGVDALGNGFTSWFKQVSSGAHLLINSQTLQ